MSSKHTTKVKDEDSRPFPQRRNGVRHAEHGLGVVTIGPAGSPYVWVQFEGLPSPLPVFSDSLQSWPSKGVSPDPAESRRSGWCGGNNYRLKK